MTHIFSPILNTLERVLVEGLPGESLTVEHSSTFDSSLEVTAPVCRQGARVYKWRLLPFTQVDESADGLRGGVAQDGV